VVFTHAVESSKRRQKRQHGWSVAPSQETSHDVVFLRPLGIHGDTPIDHHIFTGHVGRLVG